MTDTRRLAVVERCPHGYWFTHRRPFWEWVFTRRYWWCAPAVLLADRQDYEAVRVYSPTGEVLAVVPSTEIIYQFVNQL